ncbi:MAG: T9SS type A sorting domain-containing protein [Flavobacteriaceae bacterium]|nr:T9SS type A sorting domain-containing protein [Flavobacteriaceae bacterium]
MRTLYFILCLLFISPISSQNYDFGIIHLGSYDFKIVAIPDFDSSGNTDVSDVGFALMLPAGMSDVVSQVSLLAGRTWNVTEFDAAFLTGQGLGDGNLDSFQFNMPPGQSLVGHTSGQQIDLVSFQVSNMPSTGNMFLLLNSDPTAMGAGGALDSFYNANIDNTSTIDYFNAPAPGLDSFNFDTLSIEPVEQMVYDITIDPNPTSGKLFIRTDLDIQSVELYDLLGKRLLNLEARTDLVDLSNFESGMYIIIVHGQNSKFIKRIIKD